MWTATLSDNYEFHIDRLDDYYAWRRLSELCSEKSLQIKQLKFMGKVIDKNADRYCIIYECTGIIGGTKEVYKIGACSYRSEPNQTRIVWYNVDKGNRVFSEVQKGQHQIMQELGIDKLREVSEA